MVHRGLGATCLACFPPSPTPAPCWVHGRLRVRLSRAGPPSTSHSSYFGFGVRRRTLEFRNLSRDRLTSHISFSAPCCALLSRRLIFLPIAPTANSGGR